MKTFLFSFFVSFLTLSLLFGSSNGFEVLANSNWNTSATVKQSYLNESLENRNGVSYNASAATEMNYSAALEDLGIRLHPGETYKPESNGSPSSLNHCMSLVYRTLTVLPKEAVGAVNDLTLYFSNTGSRGLAGGNRVILRCQNVTDEELVAVLVHEVGHIVDTGVINGNWLDGKSEFMDGSKPVYANDPSTFFYRLSFRTDKSLKPDADEKDFVSGYAMTDPFEDFAESYAYYVLHGDEFRKLARYNKVLKRKYRYIKYTVFDGVEFSDDRNVERLNVLLRKFDVTVLDYDMERFLAGRMVDEPVQLAEIRET